MVFVYLVSKNEIVMKHLLTISFQIEFLLTKLFNKVSHLRKTAHSKNIEIAFSATLKHNAQRDTLTSYRCELFLCNHHLAVNLFTKISVLLTTVVNFYWVFCRCPAYSTKNVDEQFICYYKLDFGFYFGLLLILFFIFIFLPLSTLFSILLDELPFCVVADQLKNFLSISSFLWHYFCKQLLLGISIQTNNNLLCAFIIMFSSYVASIFVTRSKFFNIFLLKRNIPIFIDPYNENGISNHRKKSKKTVFHHLNCHYRKHRHCDHVDV